MNVNKRYFEDLLRSRGMSLRALAEQMGLSHSQLSLTFSGFRKLQLHEAAQLAEIFGRPLREVALNAGAAAAARADCTVPIVGVLCGNGEIDTAPPNEFRRALGIDGLPNTAQAIQARTVESPLAWLDGWTFYYDPRDGVEGDALGRLCVVRLRSGRMAMGTLRRGYSSGAYALSGPIVTAEALDLISASPVLMTRH